MRNTTTPSLRRKDLWVLAVLVLISLAVRIPGAYSRAIWYDEAITLLETAGHPAPTWSDSPVPAATQKELLIGAPSFSEIAIGLRETDVHPPTYYVLLSKWRLITGGSIEAARLFSVLVSTASVVLLFLLLNSAGFARPFASSVVYALSSGAVHYGHEARNYSLAMLLIIAGSLCAFVATNTGSSERRQFWISSLLMAVLLGLAFTTNYLSIFPAFFLLSWYVLWLPNGRRLHSIPPIIVTSAITMAMISILPTQLAARPKQFQNALSLGEELKKIFDFNSSMLWNSVHANSGIRVSVFGAVIALGILSSWYVFKNWRVIDKRISSMMIGLAVAPSAGILALDLIFNKDLGKSSYVLFAGPAVAFLLTLAGGFRKTGDDDSKRQEGRPVRVFLFVLPFFVGLQLAGINFDLERTPGFAGSTIRSMAATIEASSPAPLVVIGAGHGRGDPASVIYELKPETTVCVVASGSDPVTMRQQISRHEGVWFVFAKGRKTAAQEDELFESLLASGEYRVISRSKRLAHLVKKR